MNLLKIRKAIVKHIQSNFVLYFALSLLLILGIIVGSFMVKQFSITEQSFVLKMSSTYFRVARDINYSRAMVFRHSIFSNLFQVLLLWFLGLVNLGFIIIPIIIIFKGFAIGYTVGYLVNYFGFKGFLISLLGVYIQNLFVIPAIICICALAMVMSYKYGISFKRNLLRANTPARIREYTILILVFTLLLLISSIIEGFISPGILRFTLAL